MLEIDILFNLPIKDCMFITTIIEISKGCLHFIVIGHTNGLEEAWLLVLVGHPHHTPPLALCSNLNPNGFLYSMPHPPTHLCINNHLSCQLHILFNSHFFTSKFSMRKWLVLPIHLLLCSFAISHIHYPWQNRHSIVQVKSWTSPNCFVCVGDSSLSTLESTT